MKLNVKSLKIQLIVTIVVTMFFDWMTPTPIRVMNLAGVLAWLTYIVVSNIEE